MSGTSSAGQSLDELLQAAGIAAPEPSILLTGVILRADSAEHFVLQRHGWSRAESARLRKADVIGQPIVVPASRLPISELGNTLHAVRVRKGAPATLLTERTHRVGDAPRMPAILESYGGCKPADNHASPASSLNDLLAAAASGLGPDYSVFPGVIHPGPTAEEILLQVDPPGMLDYAIIKRADILDADAIQEVPGAAVPMARSGFRIHLVKVREGAIVRAVSGMNVPVERQPSEQEGCGCQRAPAPQPASTAQPLAILPGHDPEKGTQHYWWGDVCWETTRRGPNGKLDFFCEVEFAHCTGWFHDGVCRTMSHWLWGQRCTCAGAI